MTGLEAILDQIQQEAASQAEELLSAARTEAESTLAAAREKAQRQSGEILSQAQRQADAIRERAESAARLEKRNQLLACKQQLIREAVSKVCDSLENAPAEGVLFHPAGTGSPVRPAGQRRDDAECPGFAAASRGVFRSPGQGRSPGGH